MTQKNYTIIRLSQSSMLRFLTIATLLLSLTAFIPQAQRPGETGSDNLQKISLPNPVPIASPGHLSKTTIESGESFSAVQDCSTPDEHLPVFSTRKHYSIDFALLMSSYFVYTQTTSSFL